ncbi:hypothetical protein EMPS_09130 [Entomortierella parvispora]|uniref:Uncharacterized protein n=1 Tax=Entomortierella parvispora TaxID=205924 RepID=A0A9P3HHP0_9FUNG|nr:hypothetical protein EMPS_09130 [Entomortierella parvispora]
MVNLILCTCERLVSIKADMVEVRDVVCPCSSSSLPSSSLFSCLQAQCQSDTSLPWVCKDLQEWRIGITVGSVGDEVTETVRLSRLIFARLAGLTKLRRLVVQFSIRDDLLKLEFRLDRGLEQLKTLQHLESISCLPQLSEEDSTWVMDTFPRYQQYVESAWDSPDTI